MRILHITAHMGAGAGKAISGLALSDEINKHKIILLDRPEKVDHLTRCEQLGIEVIICPSSSQMIKEVSEADVVIVNWWHHPLIYKALSELSGIPARVVLWSHVNGLNYPKLKPEFAKHFDACMFTSKASFHNPDWSDEEKECIHKKSELVYGMGDFNPKAFKAKQNYGLKQEIKAGYVGSLDYAKLHPDFTKWLKETVKRNPQVRFMVAGDLTQALSDDMDKIDISANVEYLGFRTDIAELLCQWDIFIYPLNPVNFATTENALLEAMAAGLPIVVSDGIVERSIIDDGETGFLVSDEYSFAERVNELLENEELRTNMGQKARKTVIETYDSKWNLSRFLAVMNTAMNNPKKMHDFISAVGNDAFRWFLVGCGDGETELMEELSKCNMETDEWKKKAEEISRLQQIYKGQSKGSVKQFSRYYPNDKRLDNLTKIIDEV